MVLLCFFAALAFFHASEFALAAFFFREELGLHSFLFSKPYCIAMASGLAEYGIEQWLLGPRLRQKCSTYAEAVSWVGLAMVCAGEFIRKTGMLTAGGAFTHQVQARRRPGHALVSHGIYRLARHPGYLGWYLWSVGTQVLLCNPLCAVAFAVVAARFFRDRLAYEERRLLEFFPGAYAAYAARTRTWIPFAPGVVPFRGHGGGDAGAGSC